MKPDCSYITQVRFGFLSLLLLTVMALASTAWGAPLSIWSSNTVPAVLSDPDTTANELGVKFRSAVNGYVIALRVLQKHQ